MSDDLSAVEALYAAALERPPAERPAFLDAACPDHPALRAEVERLLAAHAAAAGFLEPLTPATASLAPGGAAPTASLAPGDPTASLTARPGTLGPHHTEPGPGPAGPGAGAVLAGRYKLVEPIGEGGMGAVWLAHQTAPVKRSVAVKLIRAGMDSKQVLARFEAERQALALMDHPNIAKVLDAGTTEGGRPFFVMELVKGVPITQFCDERKLTPRERLELFVSVCQAVQHAHQKGVIHRDIKPSNVLVALYDDRPVPKVIDFGVAKATGGAELTEHTLDTGFGGVVGTPEYMSPEQATFNQLDVDTRSDVYALGVLLYELLAGSPPFRRKELEKAGLLEILRVVREEEPPRPSTKLSTAGALPSISANRGTDPKRLTALLRGELDWIVLKALEKDRNRRYETANGFAADVQRYLAGEPVQAVPPSRRYRLKKFLKRNTGPVLATAVVFAALLAGVAGTAWQASVAEAARRDAVAAQDEEAKERTRAETEWHRAEGNSAVARAHADAAFGRLYLSDVRNAQRAWDMQQFDVARELLAGLVPERTGGRDYRGPEWHLLHQRSGGISRSIPVTFGDGAGVLIGAVSGDGGRFAASPTNRTLMCKLVDVRSGNELRSWNTGGGGAGPPTALALSFDGSRVFCGTFTGHVIAWDAGTGAELWRVRPHQSVITTVRSDRRGDRVALPLAKQGAIVLDGSTGKEVSRFRGHAGICRSVAFSPDGGRVASVARIEQATGTTGEIRVWDATSGDGVASLPLAVEPLRVAYRPDGRQVAALCFAIGGPRTGDSELVLWDPTQPRATTCPRPRAPVPGRVPWRVLNYSPDSARLVTAREGAALAVVDAATGEELRTLEQHEGEPLDAVFGPDGHRLFSLAESDGALREWDLDHRPWTRLVPVPSLGKDVFAEVAVSPDGATAATRGSDTIDVWDLDTGTRLREVPAPRNQVVGFTPDGTRLVSTTFGGSPRVVTAWDTRTWRPSSTWEVPLPEGLQGFMNGVAIRPDGAAIAAAFSDRTVRVFDLTSGRERVRYRCPAPAGAETPVLALAFSPDGSHLAGIRGSGPVLVWAADSPDPILGLLPAGATAFSGLTFLSDRQLLTCDGKQLRTWDVPSGRPGATAPCLGNCYSLASLSGRNRALGIALAGTPPYALRVWEGTTLQEVLSLPSTSLHRLFVSRDGRRIVAGEVGGIRVWDAPGVLDAGGARR